MNLLITGSTGFVGKNLIQYLSNEYSISTLLRNQELKIKDAHCVIHLAGKAHDLKHTSSPEQYYQVNFELTKSLYDHFLRSNAKKFIFISSVKACADSIDGIMTEELEPSPKTDYGKSKLMAEEYIKAQRLPQGKEYYILRPCMIHGPGNKGNLNLLYKFVKKGIPYPLAAFDNKRSFLSIENLSFVIKELIENNITSGIYNVADDESLSTKEVIAILASSLEKTPRLWAIPSGIIKILSRIGDLIRLPLNTERLNKLTENYVVSNGKILKAIKKQLPLNSKEGLLMTTKTFKK